MKTHVNIKGEGYSCDLQQGTDISIPYVSGSPGPNCFYAPLYEASPLRSGDFIGDIDQGSPVNFYNVRINPHGNGTHTECMGHITSGPYYINEIAPLQPLIARLITLYPKRQDDGDLVIMREQLDQMDWTDVSCAIVRTMPNDESKMQRVYSGTNPPYVHHDAIAYLATQGVDHLVVDLPSVDREEDGGHLLGHKAWWTPDITPHTKKTITELVFIPDTVKDGLFLCSIQVAPLRLDAAPSRLVLYPLIHQE